MNKIVKFIKRLDKGERAVIIVIGLAFTIFGKQLYDSEKLENNSNYSNKSTFNNKVETQEKSNTVNDVSENINQIEYQEYKRAEKKIIIPDDLIREAIFSYVRVSNNGGNDFANAYLEDHIISVNKEYLTITEPKGSLHFKITSNPHRSMDYGLNTTFYTFKVINKFNVESTVRFYDGDRLGLIQYWGNNTANWYLF